MRFPMCYGDSLIGYFHGTGIYCDELPIRLYGRYKTKADGLGCLVIPEGDTLRNVIRLHTEEQISTLLYKNRTGNLMDMSFTVDSIDRHLTTDSALITIDTYRWYVSGYRYPVLEMRKRTLVQQNTVNSTTAFFYPPSKQYTLCNDIENEMTRSRSMTVYNNYPQPTNPDKHSLCQLTLEANDTDAILSFQLSHDAVVSFSLYTQAGIKVYESNPKRVMSGCHKEVVSLGCHANNVYLLSIHIDEEHIYEKIILKK
jgi:hypothetical protein